MKNTIKKYFENLVDDWGTAYDKHPVLVVWASWSLFIMGYLVVLSCTTKRGKVLDWVDRK